jgi:hypothetical protein
MPQAKRIRDEVSSLLAIGGDCLGGSSEEVGGTKGSAEGLLAVGSAQADFVVG